MGLTSRRPRPLERGDGQVRDSRLVIIAAEGRKTEAQYFSMFRSTRVQLKVLPTPAGDSAPEAVLARLADFRAEYELTADDALWLMVDVDRWGEKTLARVCREARSRGFGLAISRPCFETWLLFHYRDRAPELQRCDEIERELRTAAGGSYNKTRLDLDALWPLVPEAEKRAREADLSPQARWPEKAGSHIYRLIASLPPDCLQ